MDLCSDCSQLQLSEADLVTEAKRFISLQDSTQHHIKGLIWPCASSRQQIGSFARPPRVFEWQKLFTLTV